MNHPHTGGSGPPCYAGARSAATLEGPLRLVLPLLLRGRPERRRQRVPAENRAVAAAAAAAE